MREKSGNISVPWYYILPFVGTAAAAAREHGKRKKRLELALWVQKKKKKQLSAHVESVGKHSHQ